MDFVGGMLKGAMMRSSGKSDGMVFDWKRAAELIKERKPKIASAGLRGDWEWTGGTIYSDGKPTPREETYVFLASIWATPELELDGDTVECFVKDSERPDWDSGTYWPQEALDILNSAD